MSDSVKGRLERAIAANEIVVDDAQLHAANLLDRVRSELQAAAQRTPWQRITSLLKRMPDAPVRGLYLWGSVGRGKTYLMDLFFDSLPADHALREHFYRFMRTVHHELKSLAPRRDPLDAVAAGIAQRYSVVCLDEFFVADIGDAMMLAGLLQGLFSRGVTLVTTSNVAPQDLYKEGLQRQRFLPAIALIERHLEAVEVDGAQDHRLRHLQRSGTYLDTTSAGWSAQMHALFVSLAGRTLSQNSPLVINERPILVRAHVGGVIWFDFAALCDSARSAADYIDIAQSFHTVLLSEVPLLDETKDNAARRFITLVDEFYDRCVKLIISAAAPPRALYQGTRLTFEFERTVSRLIEMQSADYLAKPHLSLVARADQVS